MPVLKPTCANQAREVTFDAPNQERRNEGSHGEGQKKIHVTPQVVGHRACKGRGIWYIAYGMEF